jgi:hypothetical protein
MGEFNASLSHFESCGAVTCEVTTLFNETEAPSIEITANFSRIPMIALLSVAAALANLLVMICIIRDKKLRRPANFYVFSLSVNELVIALIPINGLLVYNAYDGWPFGILLCQVCTSGRGLFLSLS